MQYLMFSIPAASNGAAASTASMPNFQVATATGVMGVAAAAASVNMISSSRSFITKKI
jgi:hypothetical protein